MRVLHICRVYFPDGCGVAERAVHSIASQGRAHGTDSRVLTVSARGGSDEADLSGYRIKRYSAWRNGGSLSFVARFRREAAWADLLHFHFPWPCAQWAYLLGRVSAPAVATVHSGAGGGAGLARFGQDGFLGRMRRIIVTSPDYLEESAIPRGLHGKVEIVPVGVEDVPARDPEAVWRWRQRIGQRFFVFLGGLRDDKGAHHLLDALKGRDYPLAIAGDGPELPALEARAEAAGLRNVRFLGELGDDDKHDLLAAAYGFVQPPCRRDEACALAQVEASVHGVPMISCETGAGASDVNVHEKTGLVVPSREIEALGAAMDRFWLEPAQVRAWGDAARQRYVARFTDQAMVARHAACYRAILGRAA
ncbi:glycosyltransferase [Pigmentiphaga sp.]|uniref:glycosyltransferase n=1 Tax=Pigmentiphaga sp. TaxID=1977564 RepID=UPI0025D519AE|nr:glycosyltransferase [Pigmentiphaga sp.]